MKFHIHQIRPPFRNGSCPCKQNNRSLVITSTDIPKMKGIVKKNMLVYTFLSNPLKIPTEKKSGRRLRPLYMQCRPYTYSLNGLLSNSSFYSLCVFSFLFCFCFFEFFVFWFNFFSFPRKFQVSLSIPFFYHFTCLYAIISSLYVCLFSFSFSKLFIS